MRMPTALGMALVAALLAQPAQGSVRDARLPEAPSSSPSPSPVQSPVQWPDQMLARSPDQTPARSPALVAALGQEAPALRPEVLELALNARAAAAAAGLVPHPEVLTVIDYSLPSTERRLWVFDLEKRRLLFHELVAHGQRSGENQATRFSNRLGSRQTSLGLFVTADTYDGENGYSLRLDGLEAGINDRARDRAIVIHGAPYVSASTVAELGRLGRSLGCPAVSKNVARGLIDTIKGGTAVFAYYPEWKWLARSAFLKGRAAARALASGGGEGNGSGHRGSGAGATR